MQTIVRLPKPVIAEVHGVATAAGCQLVATCDLAVAAEDARFATPGVNIGLFCSTPMVALTRAVGRKAAMEMLLTGELIDAATAKQLGLVNRVVPRGASCATRPTRSPGRSPANRRFTVTIGKEAFYRQAELDLAAAYAYASEVMTQQHAGPGRRRRHRRLYRKAPAGLAGRLSAAAPVTARRADRGRTGWDRWCP